MNATEPARDEAFATVNVKLQPNDNQRTTLRAKLDTRAQGNLLSLRLYIPSNVPATPHNRGIPKAKNPREIDNNPDSMWWHPTHPAWSVYNPK